MFKEIDIETHTDLNRIDIIFIFKVTYFYNFFSGPFFPNQIFFFFLLKHVLLFVQNVNRIESNETEGQDLKKNQNVNI